MVQICNIKFSFTVSKKHNLKQLLHAREHDTIHHSNYSVLRPSGTKPVYILFYSGHVNCTGVRDSSSIPSSVSLLQQLLNLPEEDIGRIRVDNISAVSKVKSPLALWKLKKPQGEVIQVCHNPERFAGAHVKLNKGGCCILFENGKVVFVGGKSIQHLNYMEKAIQDVLPT